MYIGLGVVGGGIYAGVGGKIVDETVFDDAGGKYGIPGFNPLPLAPGRYMPATSLPDENESVSTKLVCVFLVPWTRMSFPEPVDPNLDVDPAPAKFPGEEVDPKPPLKVVLPAPKLPLALKPVFPPKEPFDSKVEELDSNELVTPLLPCPNAPDASKLFPFWFLLEPKAPAFPLTFVDDPNELSPEPELNPLELEEPNAFVLLEPAVKPFPAEPLTP